MHYRKSTDFWATFGWKPGGCTGNGKCNAGQCGQGTFNDHGKFKHKKVVGGENDRRVSGKEVKKQLWHIPKMLTAEILGQILPQKQTKLPDGRPCYVIDLFSGGESWKQGVESAGFRYLPVDLNVHKS